MDFNSILTLLRPEISLLAVTLILLVYDLVAGPAGRKYFQTVAFVLVALHVVGSFFPVPEGELFGGMFQTTRMGTLVKAILSLGTLLVFLQVSESLKKQESEYKMGEYYVLTLFTLFGMYIMISSGNFLMLYLGLETASVPLACLVAFDKYKHHSAEAGAKFILTAALSSGVLLYGISMIYGTCGTLYFADVPYLLDMSAMQIAGMVFFMAGLGFKISLVPFHLWTADVYQGAPTSTTAYLSVVSKGSAAFVLMLVLFKVFAPLAYIWKDLMYGLIIVTITVANLFAIRQNNIKRFFAFSSISQAGYIMLAVIGGSAFGMTSLVFYGILATAIALVAEKVGFWLLGCVWPENSLIYQLIEYFVIVAFAEEGAKYYLLKKRTWMTPAFNFTFDGVVYAAFVSLGFALWENISYVTSYGLDVAVIRRDRDSRSRLLWCIHGRILWCSQEVRWHVRPDYLQEVSSAGADRSRSDAWPVRFHSLHGEPNRRLDLPDVSDCPVPDGVPAGTEAFEGR